MKYKKYIKYLVICFCLVGILVCIQSLAPGSFPKGKILEIKPGMGLGQTADLLKDQGLIKSTFLFKVYATLLHKDVKASDYIFTDKQSSFDIAFRLLNGIDNLPKIKITFREGLTVKDIGKLLKKSMSDFDDVGFDYIAKNYEGELFPDTYYFYINVKPTEVLKVMHANFDDKTKDISSNSLKSSYNFADVLKMASIVEKEATSSKDRKTIAGILWKRIKNNYPLQVDPPFYYLFGKDSAHITITDLAIDSPYNLYKNKGLPPTPICNPGLQTIKDTIEPIESPYFYYLSDAHGNMHYAKTYEGHLANIEKYMNKP